MFACVGITTVDLFNSGIEKMPDFGGDEFTVDNLAFCDNPLQLALGGNGAIAAYVLARLGAPALLCSAVGQDQLGDLVKGWLTQAGVDTSSLLHIANAATASTTVMTDAALNRVSFHHAGASQVYNPRNLPSQIWDNVEMLLLSSYTLLPAWRPNGFAKAAAEAHAGGITTALDIGPAIGQVAQLQELQALLPAIDYFICNAHEMSVCTGSDELPTAMKMVRDAGAGAVITKQGERGAFVLQKDGSEPVQIPGFAVDAHFTVGAGDTFNAAFLFALHNRSDVPGAVRFANAVAALVVSAARGSLGAPTLENVETFLENSSGEVQRTA